MNQNLVVHVKNGCKSYRNHTVLQNFTMSVKKGTIYGLLGASGCGKTTLLRCIVGRKNLDKGEIWTLEMTPGAKKSDIPGPRIGYMPQELALVPEYTVKETIFFFGRLANMSDTALSNRFDTLSTILELPPKNKFMTECSGGQQRRISLAGAIVHEPELLILDEPTVGLDSILRDKIWNHIKTLVSCGITIIMTTHYIEECMSATHVGLMRNGQLLIEGSPQSIIALYGCNTLEQAFLHLCMQQKNQILNNNGFCQENESLETASEFSSYQSQEELIHDKTKQSKLSLKINRTRLRALLHKNWTQFKRNKLGLFIFGVLPISQTIFIIFGLGGNIKDLNLGILNNEVSRKECSGYNKSFTAIPNNETYECEFRNLSCRYLEYLVHPMIQMVYYDNIDEAFDDILHGNIIGFLNIPTNFSMAFEKKMHDFLLIDNETLKMGNIDVHLDMSNKMTGGNLKHKLLDLFADFLDDLFRSCYWNERLGRTPLKIDFLYGESEESFLIFLIPGFVSTIGFFASLTMCSQIILAEKHEGVWDRSLTTGATTTEILLGHMLLQIPISLFQCCVPVLTTFLVCRIEYQGCLVDLLVICGMESFCALTLGFWISIACTTQTQAHYLITGIQFPLVFLSGVLWPLESFPQWLRSISKFSPLSLPISAFRNVMRKGWTLWDSQIMLNNSLLIAWTVIFILLGIVQIKKRK